MEDLDRKYTQKGVRVANNAKLRDSHDKSIANQEKE
jgi:hypothetical protein